MNQGPGTPRDQSYGAGYAGLGACFWNEFHLKENSYGRFYTSYEGSDDAQGSAYYEKDGDYSGIKGGGRIVILVKNDFVTSKTNISASGQPICGEEMKNDISGGSGGYIYL